MWAHRGASAFAPENTLAAFELARHMGAHGVELDVRLCASGEAVVLHDPDLSRVAGVPLKVELTAYEELRRYDLGGGERIPSLADVLESIRDIEVNIELKSDEVRLSGLESAVASAVRRARAEDRVLFSCFHPVPLWRLKSLMPHVPRALLFGASQAWHLRRGWHAAGIGARAMHPEHLLVSWGAVRRWHRAGFAVNVWTVNEPGRIRELAAMRVDSVITDMPDVALRALRNPGPPAPSD